MQRDHRLAGAGAARDDRHALVGRTDRLVLLGLDGGDDVAHPGPTGPLQRRHQGALADHHQVCLGGVVQQVVLDASHLVVATTQDAAADDAHRVGGGGAVERFGCRGAPVDHQRFVVVVAHADAADVARLCGVEVESSEDQALMLGVQDRQPFGGLEGEGVPLEQSGTILLTHPIGAVGLELGPAFCLDVACRGRCRLEVVVHLVDVRLFDGQLIGQDLGRVWGVCFGQLDPSSEKDLRVHATPRIQELF